MRRLPLVLALASVGALAQPKANPYLDPAARLYQNLEFQEAFRTIEKGLEWPGNTPEEDERASLLEGIITAQLGKTERAVGAFKRALAMDPVAKLPFRVSPKISRLFQRAQKELGVSPSAAAKKTPPPPAPPPETPPVAPAPPPLVEAPAKPAPAPPVEEKTHVIVAQADAPPPRLVEPPAVVQPVESKATPLFGGAFGIVDVLGKSIGSELFFGTRLSTFELTLRCRPGRPETSLGLLFAYDRDLGPLALFAGLRGDVYVNPLFPGGGVVVGARRALVGPLDVIAAGSFEAFATSLPQFRRTAAVVSLGLEWRPTD